MRIVKLKPITKHRRFISVVIFNLFLLGLIHSAYAAILYIQSPKEQYKIGETIIAEIRLDPQKECINTIVADLKFPNDLLEFKDFSDGESIINIWLNSPNFINPEKMNAQGLIKLMGGITGGYCGRMPGDPGKSNTIGQIIFQVKNEIKNLSKNNTATIEFSKDDQVLLNNGLGSMTKLTTQNIVFDLIPQQATNIINLWQKELTEDKIPPEKFAIKINQDQNIFDGQYFITFITADKQSGLDHYEIKEGDGMWQITTSPYLLKDQALKSVIIVKAVDKASNERTAQYRPALKIKKPAFWLYWLLGLVVILIIALLGYCIYILKKYIFSR